jgi:hypothetical protein
VLLQPQQKYTFSVTVYVLKFGVWECNEYVLFYECTNVLLVHPEIFVNNFLVLYLLQIALLNQLLLLRSCVTCTHSRLPQDWCNMHVSFNIKYHSGMNFTKKMKYYSRYYWIYNIETVHQISDTRSVFVLR